MIDRARLRQLAEAALSDPSSADLYIYRHAVTPGVMIKLLDALEGAEKLIRREVADDVIRICSMSGDRQEGIIGRGLAMIISPTPVSQEALDWAKSVAETVEADIAVNGKGRSLKGFIAEQRELAKRETRG